MIHPTAIIDPHAVLGENLEIGPYAVIGPDVVLGDGCQIHAHAVIDGNTTLGKDCQVFESAHIGGKTQDLKFKTGNVTYVKIGDRTVLREFVTVNCGTNAGESTVIGDDCLLMAYCHVAHGCVLGNHVIVSNATQFAGEVHVGDWAVISGLVGCHQFIRIGCHAMIGGATVLKQDAAPYIITDGNDAHTFGVNLVGLKRRGFPAETVHALHAAYKLLCKSGMNISDAVQAVREQVPDLPEVRTLVEFFETTKRGVIR